MSYIEKSYAKKNLKKFLRSLKFVGKNPSKVRRPKERKEGSEKKMASRERSIHQESDEKGSSRVDGEPISSNKRPSGEIKTDDSKRQKITFGVGGKQNSGKDSKGMNAKGNPKPGIQIKLSSNKQAVPIPPVKSRPTAAIFNNDDDDEPEEMPPEAKMRMRNIGRDTPTSAGPNSFGKTKQGFCDSKKVFEKSLKAAIEKAGTD